MKIQYHSDLHIEFFSKLKTFDWPIEKDTDVLVFAGDISNNSQDTVTFFSNLRNKTSIPILYVLGNHEYYGGFFRQKQEEYFKALKKIDITILDRNEPENQGQVVIGDILFVGTTLYSDLSNPINGQNVRLGLNDFRKVKDMSIDLWQSEFDLSCTMIDDALFAAKQNRQKVVVISHFAPLTNLIEENNAYSDGFASDLSEMILQYQPNAWIYGHTHYNRDFELENTKIVSNSLGYRFEKGTLKTKVIEV